MSSRRQDMVNSEKRQYNRLPINGWLLLFDGKTSIEMAQVINISQGGVLCASLAKDCPDNSIQEFELYGSRSSTSISGLCGRIVHNDYRQAAAISTSDIHCFTFGLKFLRTTPEQLSQIEKIASKR